ncbi:MAG: VanW family protein [Candidatus Promineifilaceae bacterium]
MQATNTAPSPGRSGLARKVSWFLAVPITAAVILAVLLFIVVTTYQQGHDDKIYTGVYVWGKDLSGLTQAEAVTVLEEAFPYPEQKTITMVVPDSGEEWTRTLADLGLSFDSEATVETAFEIGRSGGPIKRLLEQFDSWYYGRQLAPIVVFDEGALDEAITEIAKVIYRPAADASLAYNGIEVGFTDAQTGRDLDMTDTRRRLIYPVTNLQEAEVQLLVHESKPRVLDTSASAKQLEYIMSDPMTLYLEEPLDGVDLEKVVLPVEDVLKWVRIQTVEDDEGKATTEVLVDRNAVLAWLESYRETLERDPENARFYFDDATSELVLVEPHVSGRELDVEATADQFIEQVMTSDHSMPFVLDEIIPAVNSDATAADLSISELVSESTTWFYGSSNERKHNIARAAANFYGIVVAPGEEFSFNNYLGEVSAEQGYETGLIIFGGRTIEGVGGGVCQVSTTAFQAAFWGGFPIVERWEHGYQVGYYDDGEGPGMDATVYSPLVDLRFINDTPHYLLIENYYNEANSSLTFKFYSTSMGRTVVKEGPVIENVTPAKPDIWELNEDLDEGEIEQIDWAVEGADVTVERTVYNLFGDLLRQDTFVSHYIPWQNIFQYGPGTELPEPEPTPELTPESTAPAPTPTPTSQPGG